MDEFLTTLKARKDTMIQYLLLKLEEEDWHGIQDAASDLRDIENLKLGYLQFKKEWETPKVTNG